LESHIAGLPCRRGKVRDVYDLGDRLVIVATDRISAFDWVLPTGIPDKGCILTAMTLFWFDFLGVPNHLLGTDLRAIGPAFAAELRRRSLDIYVRAAKYAESHGILLADTKFEWGTLPNGSVILIDEVLTPDSSRFWPADSYRAGSNPPSFDKQFVRDWL